MESRDATVDDVDDPSPASLTVVDQGVVIMLDALGIKGILARKSAERVAASWAKVVQVFRESATKAVDSERGCTTCTVTAFSDTIVVTLDGPVSDNLILLAGELMSEAYCAALWNEIVLRGAFAVGSFYSADSALFGPAIDEATEWYGAADWSGIAATPTANMMLDRLEQVGGHADIAASSYIRAQVPWRSMSAGTAGPDAGWVVDWPNNPKSPPTVDLLQILSSPPIGPSIWPKYRNTFEFVARCRTAFNDAARRVDQPPTP